MGQSTDAILVYGIPYGEGDEYEIVWNDEELSISDLPYRRKFGENYKNISYKEKWDWEKNNPLAVEMVQHCSDGYTMYIIGIAETKVVSSRGDETVINPDMFKTDMSNNDAELKKFCEFFDIEYQQPKWYLVSWRG